MFKKVISLGLAVIMTVSLETTAFAFEDMHEIDNTIKEVQTLDGYEIKENGYNSIIIKSDNSTDTISFVEDSEKISVSILNQETGNTEYIIRDKETNTIYSSITGETVKLKDLPKKSNMLRKSTTGYDTYKLSYAEMRSIIGDNASVSGLASLVLSIIPGLNGVAGVAGMISTIVGGVSTMFIPNNSNNGFKISYKVKKYYRGPYGHKHVYKKVYTILDISKY